MWSLGSRGDAPPSAARVKVQLVLPAGPGKLLSAVLAPYGVLSRRCDVMTVCSCPPDAHSQAHCIKEFASGRGNGKLGIRADFSFETAPLDCDVVVVPAGGLQNSRVYEWLESRYCKSKSKSKSGDGNGDSDSDGGGAHPFPPLVVSIKGATLAILRGPDREKRKTRLDSSYTHVDTSLDVLDAIFNTATADWPEAEEGASDPCSPGDTVAEDLGLFERHVHNEELARFDSTDTWRLLSTSLASLFNEQLVAVLLFDGVDEVSVATILDAWGSVPGMRVVPLAVRTSKAKANEAETEVIGAHGLRLVPTRRLGDFAAVPAAVASLGTVIIPPCTESARALVRPDLVARALGAGGISGGTWKLWDQGAVRPSDALATQLSRIEADHSLSIARKVFRGLRVQ